MQLNSVYLYPNKIDVFTNTLASWTTERYRRVYNRNLKLYRSVDNRVDLQVRNSNEKAATIGDSTLVFNLITREGKDLILSKDCTTLDALTGKVYVTFTERELFEIENGHYNYSIVQETREDINDTEYRVLSKKVMYQDSQYGAVGNIEISGDVLGEGEPSLVVDKFALINPATTGYTDPKYYVSSIIDTAGHTQIAQSLHTFQIYFKNEFSGNIKIQGSLSEGGTPSVWADINSFDVNTQVAPVYKTVVGKYNFFRILSYPTTSTSIAEFVVSQTILGGYEVSIKEDGRGYRVNDIITIPGAILGGETPGQNLYITVQSVDTLGKITTITWTGNSYNGVKTYVVNGELPTAGIVDKILYR